MDLRGRGIDDNGALEVAEWLKTNRYCREWAMREKSEDTGRLRVSRWFGALFCSWRIVESKSILVIERTVYPYNVGTTVYPVASPQTILCDDKT